MLSNRQAGSLRANSKRSYTIPTIERVCGITTPIAGSIRNFE